MKQLNVKGLEMVKNGKYKYFKNFFSQKNHLFLAKFFSKAFEPVVPFPNS